MATGPVNHPVSTLHHEPYPAIDPTRKTLSQAGRTVLVTGGSSGIGLCIARAYQLASAAHIIIVARRQAALDSAKAHLAAVKPESSNTVITTKSVDVTDTYAVEELWKGLDNDNIIVDTLVLNAGISSDPGSILERGTAKTMAVYDINLKALLHFSELFKNQPESNGKRKALVNLSSAIIHQLQGAGQMFSTYSATKSAGTMLVQSLASHNKPSEMQIVSFHPGSILSDMARNAGYGENSGIAWDDGMSDTLNGDSLTDQGTENLPGHFSVWAASPEAEFLHGRFVWAHWDVEQLKGIKSRIENDYNFLKVGIVGL